MIKQGKILLAVAPNGAHKTKNDNPNIPLNTAELALTAKDCLAAGASMIHLHVRDPKDDSHSLSIELYQQAITAINQGCGQQMLVQVTSEAAGIFTPVEQFEMIHSLKPSAVSIGLREIKSLDESVIHQHFLRMKDANIHPQIILYNQYDLDNYHNWLASKILPEGAYPILLVIGKPTTEGSFDNDFLTPSNINKLKPIASSWMVCAFGENEYAAAKLAADLGGHIRIGFENNSILADGTEAQDNAALIKQISRYLQDKGIALANYDDAIEIMKPNW